MTSMLELPQISGSRRRANALIEAGLPNDLQDAVVVVDCGQLLAGTQSFADELVKIILVDRGAQTLRVVNVDRQFVAYLTEAAALHQVSDRLKVPV